MLNCQICNKRLPAYFKGDCCSPACRQKKSRNKRMAQQRAYAMGFQVDAWSKMLSEGTIQPHEARELLNAVWDRLSDFYRAIEAAEEKLQAKAEK
jgi:hypothetical protein